ncbi:MAG: type II secretion system protein [Candidatus Saccharibacteria bacterium]
MLNKIKNRKQEGFTIIEVLIVLAIAGLIMLIVFLAVPALQRNSRNTQRQADASKVTAAIASCMSARNGKFESCNETSELETNGGLEVNKLQQLTTVSPTAAPADPPTVNFQLAEWSFKSKCKDDGSGATATGATSRQSAVTFTQENGQADGVGKCIDV